MANRWFLCVGKISGTTDQKLVGQLVHEAVGIYVMVWALKMQQLIILEIYYLMEEEDRWSVGGYTKYGLS